MTKPTRMPLKMDSFLRKQWQFVPSYHFLSVIVRSAALIHVHIGSIDSYYRCIIVSSGLHRKRIGSWVIPTPRFT